MSTGRDASLSGASRVRDAIAHATPGKNDRAPGFPPIDVRQETLPTTGSRTDSDGSPGFDGVVLASVVDDADVRSEPDTNAEEIQRGPPGGLTDSMQQDFGTLFEDLWRDTKRVYTDPTNLGILLMAGGASAALRPEVDDDVEDKFNRSQSFKHDIRDALGAVGNPGTHFALAGLWYLIGTESGDTKTYEVAKTLFSGLMINGVSTMGLKVAAYTDSPNGENLAWPSGHTSSAFTFASVLHQAYGNAVGIPLYGLAGLAAFERLDSEEHHLSDVVFGATLGLVVGHTVATGHRPQIFGGDLIPFADPNDNSGGIAWMKGF